MSFAEVAILIPGGVMAKSPPPERQDDDQGPSSETARVASDLMEMARQLCFHRRGPGGKRMKLAQYLDNLLRPAITRDYEDWQRESAQGGRKKKGSDD